MQGYIPVNFLLCLDVCKLICFLFLLFFIFQIAKRTIRDDECYHVHLTCLFNLPQTIQLIRDKLNVVGQKMFLKIVFRAFHAYDDGGLFCCRFIHHLLLHQVESKHKGVLEFEFHRIGARFNKNAFVMMTGLNCGKFSKNSELTNLGRTCAILSKGIYHQNLEENMISYE